MAKVVRKNLKKGGDPKSRAIIIFLAHDGVNQPDIWEHWLSFANKEDKERIHIYVHAPEDKHKWFEKKYSINNIPQGPTLSFGKTGWCSPGIVYEHLCALKKAYDYHSRVHGSECVYYMQSGADVPVKPCSMLLQNEYSIVWGFPTHIQWLCLNDAHAKLLVSSPPAAEEPNPLLIRLDPKTGRYKQTNTFNYFVLKRETKPVKPVPKGCPDETFIGAALNYRKAFREIQQGVTTFPSFQSKFDASPIDWTDNQHSCTIVFPNLVISNDLKSYESQYNSMTLIKFDRSDNIYRITLHGILLNCRLLEGPRVFFFRKVNKSYPFDKTDKIWSLLYSDKADIYEIRKALQYEMERSEGLPYVTNLPPLPGSRFNKDGDISCQDLVVDFDKVFKNPKVLDMYASFGWRCDKLKKAIEKDPELQDIFVIEKAAEFRIPKTEGEYFPSHSYSIQTPNPAKSEFPSPLLGPAPPGLWDGGRMNGVGIVSRDKAGSLRLCVHKHSYKVRKEVGKNGKESFHIRKDGQPISCTRLVSNFLRKEQGVSKK